MPIVLEMPFNTSKTETKGMCGGYILKCLRAASNSGNKVSRLQGRFKHILLMF